MQYSDIAIYSQLCYIIIVQRTERGIEMKICKFLLDERINDNTTVIIKDSSGRQKARGRWFEDRILALYNSDASFEFDAERNIAILQIL